MQFIVIITKNKAISEIEHKIGLKNFNILLLDDTNNYQAIIQEYLPKYIILSSKIDRFKEIRHYIQENSRSELIISGKSGKQAIGIHVNEIINEKQLIKVLKLIDKLESGKNRYRVLNQQVTSVYSVQGGVGKTSIAFNIALFLSKLGKMKVLLIDLNFCEGQSDLAARLKIPVLPNLSIFMESPENSPDSLWESIFTIKKSNIDILQPPVSIEQSDGFNLDMLYEIIYSARKKYGYIICDLPNRYDNHVLETINLSTKLILLLTQDLAVAHRVERLNKFLPENQKKFAIINKLNQESHEIGRLDHNIGIPVSGSIPLLEGRSKLHGFLDMQSEISNIEELVI